VIDDVTASASSAGPAISLAGVGKRYGNTHALRDVSLAIAPGTIVGLVGENGAGKSTLVKLLSGGEQPTTGQVEIDGQLVNDVGPKAIYELGVRVVYQEGSLIDQIPLYENLVLYERTAGRAFLFDRKTAVRRTEEVLRALNVRSSMATALVANLSPSERQIAEVGRCLINAGSITILDEPTSSLSKQGAQHVLDAVRQLGRAGTTVIYVSHILEEVLEVCQRVIVLRDGEIAGDRPVAEWELKELVNAIVGRKLETQLERARERAAEPVPDPGQNGRPPAGSVLALRDVSYHGLHGVTLDVRPGEIVGVAGIGGSGKSLLGRLISGREPLRYDGSIEVMGTEARAMSRKRMMRRVGYLPSDRAREGLNPLGTVGHNLVMGKRDGSAIFIRKAQEDALAQSCIDTYRVRCRGAKDPIGQLSGGNQQKILLARAYLGDPDFVVLDEPTRGIDIGARNEIYEQIRRRAADGTTTIVISNEPEEIAALADRAVVMQRGEIVTELPRPTREEVYEATVS
jgi:ABC-type sugar transport system ATPase subunit